MLGDIFGAFFLCMAFYAAFIQWLQVQAIKIAVSLINDSVKPSELKQSFSQALPVLTSVCLFIGIVVIML